MRKKKLSERLLETRQNFRDTFAAVLTRVFGPPPKAVNEMESYVSADLIRCIRDNNIRWVYDLHMVKKMKSAIRYAQVCEEMQSDSFLVQLHEESHENHYGMKDVFALRKCHWCIKKLRGIESRFNWLRKCGSVQVTRAEIPPELCVFFSSNVEFLVDEMHKKNLCTDG